MIALLILILSIKPVSYTHLDVYKRQLIIAQECLFVNIILKILQKICLICLPSVNLLLNYSSRKKTVKFSTGLCLIICHRESSKKIPYKNNTPPIIAGMTEETVRNTIQNV